MEEKHINPYVGLAIACGTASFGVAAFALFVLHQISAAGMWAIAAMAAALSIMGIGIAYFMSHNKS
jgi:hypothetical protein